MNNIYNIQIFNFIDFALYFILKVKDHSLFSKNSYNLFIFCYFNQNIKKVYQHLIQ